MSRRRRDRSADRVEAFVRLAIGLLMLAALAIGGIAGFAKALQGLVALLVISALALGIVALVVILGVRLYRQRQMGLSRAGSVAGNPSSGPSPSFQTEISRACDRPPKPSAWKTTSVRRALDEIDWYQFEKFCAALLEADGFSVERTGGAHPDGGVDLLVGKSGARALIQCKHWRTWVVQERVVREMLGSMTHLKVNQGAIYTLKGWTSPAAALASQHEITLVNGDELAQSAVMQLSPQMLDDLLQTGVHRCPKCEALMIRRSGTFGTFWGCSRYPACRGKLKHSGAK